MLLYRWNLAEDRKGIWTKSRNCLLSEFSFFYDCIYLFERENTSTAGTEGERDADSSLSKKPDAGLNTRTPGSRPDRKADAHPLSPAGAP